MHRINPLPSAQAAVATAMLAIALSVAMFSMPAESGPLKAAAPAVAQANSPLDDGPVAVHTGRWGYREQVYGRATTRAVAQSSITDVIMIASAVVGPWGVIPATYVWTLKFRAQDALNTGQCVSIVRPVWGSPYFPAKTWWGCQ